MFLDFNRIVKYNTYPDICLFLDIEPNRSFKIEGYPERVFQIDSNGYLVDEDGYESFSSDVVCDMIRDPFSIHYTQRWTDQDIEDATTAKRMHPEMKFVRRFMGKDSTVALSKVEDLRACTPMKIDADCFPSLRRAECVALDDIINGEEELCAVG